MKTVYSEKHALHAPLKEIYCGEILDCAEKPARAVSVYETMKAEKLGEILLPKPYAIEKILRVHDVGYVDFLKNAFTDWKAKGLNANVFGTNFNIQHQKSLSPRPPQTVEGKAGYYLADTSVSITDGTWEAVENNVHVALTALDIVLGGDSSAFALCRPPGHHASRAAAAGYSFLNNAAIAAQSFIDEKGGKVAILDVDYHHGNGTQEIFYDRADVLYCSLHADPAMDFPYFSGYADEKGAGAGTGFNHNYPLPLGTRGDTYLPALGDAVKKIAAYKPDLLLVSLGVDTYKDDPISYFKLDKPDYFRTGEVIAQLNVPCLFILEGGYAIDEIGNNVSSVLKGFLNL